MTILKRLWRTLFSWSFEPAEWDELKKAGLIVAQSWSRNRDKTPGPGNKIIADVVIEYERRFGIPVFVQEEVDWCLPRNFRRCVVGVAGGSPTGKSSAKWDTLAVARLQAGFCYDHNITTVIVVAHPLHMNRALWVYESLGLRALPASMPTNYSRYNGHDLVHVSFRYHWIFSWLREAFLARPIFFLQGKI